MTLNKSDDSDRSKISQKRKYITTPVDSLKKYILDFPVILVDTKTHFRNNIGKICGC